MCKASPQTEQYDPFSGRSASKQLSQTGSRETLSSGEPQIRQSAGKKVKNKVASSALGKASEPTVRQTMISQTMVRRTLTRRLALGSAYSKPSTALLLLKTASSTRPADDAWPG